MRWRLLLAPSRPTLAIAFCVIRISGDAASDHHAQAIGWPWPNVEWLPGSPTVTWDVYMEAEGLAEQSPKMAVQQPVFRVEDGALAPHRLNARPEAFICPRARHTEGLVEHWQATA